MTIDFREQAGGNVRPFRYFTQTVLPAVYDDSLSYMELVAKTIEYLNEVIESLNANNAAVTEMQETLSNEIESIQATLETFDTYMHEYLENLDVQEEINNKLDVMASDGTLRTLMQPVIAALAPSTINQWLDDHPEATTSVEDGSITNAKLVQSGGVLETTLKLINGLDAENSSLIVLDGYTQTELDFVKRMRYVKCENNIIDKLPELRIVVWQKTSNRTSISMYNEDASLRISFNFENDSEISISSFTYNNERFTLECSFNWVGIEESSTPFINNAFNLSHVVLSDYTKTERCMIDRVEKEFDEKIFTPRTDFTQYQAYVNENNIIVPYTSDLSTKVRKYSVKANNKYIIKAHNFKLPYDIYPIAVFAQINFTGSQTMTRTERIIGDGTSTTPATFEYEFVAPSDGYIYINTTLSASNGYIWVFNTLYGFAETKQKVQIQCFGDSITDDSWRTDGTTWATLLQNFMSPYDLTLYNEAVGGSHIGHGKVTPAGTKYPELEYNYVYDLITNTDILKTNNNIIIMFAGTNDYNSSPLGAWGDNTVDTFYGAAKLICEYISTHTTALFMICTPIARDTDREQSWPTNEDGEPLNSYGHSLREYAEALIQTANFYQFPVIDLFHNMGWNRLNIGNFTDSGKLHPTFDGNVLLSEYIANKIMEHLPK